MNKENIQNNLDKIVEEAVLNGIPLKSLISLDEDKMDKVYAVGYTLYNNSKIEEASEIFNMLCSFDHRNTKYWNAFAACKRMLGQMDKAIKCYSLIRVLSPEDADSSINAAECYIKMNKMKEADDCIADAEALLEMYPNTNHKHSKRIAEFRKMLDYRNGKND